MMETFEEKARRLPDRIKSELEDYMDVVLGIKTVGDYKQGLENELDTRMKNSRQNAEPAETVVHDLAVKYGLRGKD